MSDTFYGTAYLAEHIGSTQSSVSNWAKTNEPGFPEPAVVIHSANGSISARGWTPLQLTDARDWMENRLGLSESEALEHWAAVDDRRQERLRVHRDRVSPDQEKLF